jgi:voltage-gated potassium channel
VRFLNVWVRALFEGARDPNTRPLYVAFGGLLLTGTIFYMIVEDWGPLDALYFSVTTLATVGYGDLSPKTDLGKGFTIIYILAGIGVIVAFANAVLERAGTAQREKLERAARPQYPDSET